MPLDAMDMTLIDFLWRELGYKKVQICLVGQDNLKAKVEFHSQIVEVTLSVVEVYVRNYYRLTGYHIVDDNQYDHMFNIKASNEFETVQITVSRMPQRSKVCTVTVRDFSTKTQIARLR